MTLHTIHFLAIAESEGGFSAQAIGHSIFTQAESWDELREMARDAVRCHFDEDTEAVEIAISLAAPKQ